MKHPAKLTYAALRLNGATRRYLFCTTQEKPHFGDETFDFLAYFGFGSGEFEGMHPPEYDKLRVRVVQLPSSDVEYNLAFIAKTMSQPTDEFRGFYTEDGTTFHMLMPDNEGVSLTHLSAFNWHYYTAIGGDQRTAYAHIQAMNRKHVLFETYAEQSRLLLGYSELARVI